jgi:protein-tyrosine phosphatase
MTNFTYEDFNINKHKYPQASDHTDEFIDIHCHCLPGIDDGPATQHDALALCRSLVDDGITTVIATPHQLGQYDGCNEASDIREAVISLNEDLETHHIPLAVMPGGDVRLDERICQLLKNDKILTLADGGKYILLELPTKILIDIEPLIVELTSIGVKVIVSHPERHYILNRYHDVIPKWLRHSALLQITAGSLLGDFGPLAERAAWHFIKSGWVSLVATDSHNLGGRKPRMKAAFRNIGIKMGQMVAHKLCNENPLRVLEGRNITTTLQLQGA